MILNLHLGFGMNENSTTRAHLTTSNSSVKKDQAAKFLHCKKCSKQVSQWQSEQAAKLIQKKQPTLRTTFFNRRRLAAENERSGWGKKKTNFLINNAKKNQVSKFQPANNLTAIPSSGENRKKHRFRRRVKLPRNHAKQTKPTEVHPTDKLYTIQLEKIKIRIFSLILKFQGRPEVRHYFGLTSVEFQKKDISRCRFPIPLSIHAKDPVCPFRSESLWASEHRISKLLFTHCDFTVFQFSIFDLHRGARVAGVSFKF